MHLGKLQRIYITAIHEVHEQSFNQVDNVQVQTRRFQIEGKFLTTTTQS
jgi:hypothetical protein